MSGPVTLINRNEGGTVEPTLLFVVEIPLATISVCLLSILHLFKRAFNHGIPSLFGSKNPARPLHWQYVEHVDSRGNPVDNDIRHFTRLEDGKDTLSRQRLVSKKIAVRSSNIMPQDIPLDDIQIRKDVDIQIDPSRELYAKNMTGIF